MISTSIRFIHGLLFALLTVQPVSAANDAKPVATLPEIIQKWHERERQSRTFDIEWTGQHFELGSRLLVPMERPDAQHRPPKEVSFATKRRFVCDGPERLRFDEDTMIWLSGKASLGPQSVIKINDHGLLRAFFPRGRELYAACFVMQKQNGTIANDTRLYPLRLVYRPLDEKIGVLEEAKLKLSDETAVADDFNLLVLEHDNASIWIDPARDYMPVRFARRDPYESTFVEIIYRADANYGWVPASWTNTRLNKKGEVIVSDAETVTRLSINDKVPSSEFAVSLPPGTWVSDSTTNESYIVLAGGERRLVLAGEYNGKNYEQLLHSESGSLLPKGKRSGAWLFGVGAAIGLAVLISAVWSYRALRNRPAAAL